MFTVVSSGAFLLLLALGLGSRVQGHDLGFCFVLGLQDAKFGLNRFEFWGLAEI